MAHSRARWPLPDPSLHELKIVLATFDSVEPEPSSRKPESHALQVAEQTGVLNVES